MKNLRRLLIFVRPYKKRVLLAVLLTGSLTLIGMAPPLLMRRLINEVAAEGRWGLFPLLMTLLIAVVFAVAVMLRLSPGLSALTPHRSSARWFVL